MTRVEQKQATRTALIDQARKLFAERGYANTTADMIAKAAGVSRATFYLHFRTKAEIVREHMRTNEDSIVDAYVALDDIVDPSMADVRAWLAGHVEYWRANRNDFAIMEQALAQEQAVSDEWFGMLQRVSARMRNLLGRQSDPETREVARIRVMSLLMSTDRNLQFAVVQGHDENLDTLIDVLTEQWLACFEN